MKSEVEKQDLTETSLIFAPCSQNLTCPKKFQNFLITKYRQNFGHFGFCVKNKEIAEISIKSCFLDFWCQIHILVKFHVCNFFFWKVTLKTPKNEVKWDFQPKIGKSQKIQKILKIQKIDFSHNLGSNRKQKFSDCIFKLCLKHTGVLHT